MFWDNLLHVVAAVCILTGAVFSLTGAIGVARMPDTLRRMHAATKPQVVGLLLIILGAIIELRGNVDIWMLVLVAVFTCFTAPVIAHTVSRVVHREHPELHDQMSVDEYTEVQRED
ncbi:monovalent cation/H(+) antiporter subunit G [Rhodococcus rhodnii]|uniref:Monovalent cation/H(+) antiporter subunit G n=2 Tax=Rhodococcus rhodnii TaxID=38312 RepID=A0A6P2CJU5_9NOCA|nr:monovalent cation/H(+) antiporter subunit G [Rhodococcus rhodnii]TXG92041.1 monovalent cation/H(+) antiporter subunit G [Rhodococcus rhodnii]